jgi:ubiquitin-conjugating enzyme E2 Z
MSGNFVTSIAQKRLLKDVKDVIKHPLTEHGIYYVHNDQNIMKGYACVMGPDDTIYKHGAYLFTFDFPGEYPFKPPVVKYCTNDGKTRFHPNLYRNGKVCLSILNTWKGEQWTSCQSIKTILLTLVTLFHNKPLLCEPGFKESSPDFIPFNKTIEYKNFQIAINNIESRLVNNFILFKPFIKKHILENQKCIEETLEKNKDSENNGLVIKVRTYSMSTKLDYSQVQIDFAELIKNYSKN